MIRNHALPKQLASACYKSGPATTASTALRQTLLLDTLPTLPVSPKATELIPAPAT